MSAVSAWLVMVKGCAGLHKWLNVPDDCGIALVRRPGDLRRSFAAAAAYLPPDTGFEATNHTPQSSQRARQVEVWAVLRTLGRQGVADLVTGSCRHAQTMAAYLSRAGLEVLNDVVLNQVLVRAATDEQTLAPDRGRPAGRILLVRADGVAASPRHAD